MAMLESGSVEVGKPPKATYGKIGPPKSDRQGISSGVMSNGADGLLRRGKLQWKGI